MQWLDRLKQGLTKTRETVRASVDRLVGTGPDPAALEELEEALLAADLGVQTVEALMTRVREQARRVGSGPEGGARLVAVMKEAILEDLRAREAESLEALIEMGPRPYVIMAVGVNGVGKTTTLAKLAQRIQRRGWRPLLVAADTFRAAAIEQLETWAGRLGVDCVRHRHGADPSAVVFDGMAAARARAADVVLIDTAGRLHTKVNLMDELSKMRRILAREAPGAPHEVLLVLDATVGQNALSQARQFHQAVGVTGLALTKLDGTARGGVVIAIARELSIPMRLIGVGEQAEDLQDFHADAFVEALFSKAGQE